MKSKFGDILYIDTPYRPESGSFCKPKKIENDRYRVGQWYYCRDLFHGHLLNLDLFFFSHESDNGHNVAAFMGKIEETLDVEPKSNFGPTQRKTIMWIEPSRWWTVRSMRRSFFTILLRVGCKYLINKDNFEQALFSEAYTINTRYAVKRFMDGNTIYAGRKRGWYNQFYNCKPTEKEIDALLISGN